jgi:hypothetical protein
MDGGCIVDTSDSRFSDAIIALGGHRGPVRLHDRYETQDLYDTLSR